MNRWQPLVLEGMHDSSWLAIIWPDIAIAMMYTNCYLSIFVTVNIVTMDYHLPSKHCHWQLMIIHHCSLLFTIFHHSVILSHCQPFLASNYSHFLHYSQPFTIDRNGWIIDHPIDFTIIYQLIIYLLIIIIDFTIIYQFHFIIYSLIIYHWSIGWSIIW